MSDEDILNVDPLGYDKGDSPFTILSNKMVVTHKPHDCVICREAVPVGSRARVTTEVNQERKFSTYYFCPACCEAMAASWTDNDKALLARFDICAAHG